MEKIAIISDIHGNEIALRAVLNDIKCKNIKNIICLGDIVLKNPNPHQCLELIRQCCSIILKGNTDNCVATLNEAKPEHIWTNQQLTEEEIDFLNNLPISYEMYISGHLIRFFHSSPTKLNNIMNISNNKLSTIPYSEMFQNTEFINKSHNNEEPDIVVYGHTHTSGTAHYGNKQLVNVGAVGCTVELLNHDKTDIKNKLTTMANYCIIEGNINDKTLGSLSISFIKVPYSIKEQTIILQNSDMPNKENAITEITTGIYEKR